MKKIFIDLLFCILFINMKLVAQKQESLHIISHNNITINTNQKTGTKSFTNWAFFPDKKIPVRRIKLHLTLAHPDTMPIAHWDYLDKIYIRRTGGIKGKSQDYEIARMLTPYGSSFTKTWSYTWTIDVTDFSLALRDSVEIEYIHSGYEPENLGWKLTLDFEFIKGNPIAKQLKITELVKNEFRYGDTLNPIENNLKPINIETSAEANYGTLRINHTGHGMDEPGNCSEFCSRWREIKFDNQLVDKRAMWKDCGNNPLFPQGGTWLYDRAYWCPGDLQKPDIFCFPITKGLHTIDVAMQPYKSVKGIANENITAYFIEYQTPSAANDVSLEEIIVPSGDKKFNRQNPACFHPKIRIKNLGKNNLTTLQIIYGTKGYKTKTHTWKGFLKFNEETEITIPDIIDYNEGSNEFSVSLSKPNGKTDEYSTDNIKTEKFESPKLLPEKIILNYKTNNAPGDNHIYIVNKEGKIVYNRKPENCTPNTVYTDTLLLPENKYELFMTDTTGDGLEFWAEPQTGYGYLRLLDEKQQIIHNFESDCGSGQFLAFSTTSDTTINYSTQQFAFMMYPRRTKESLELSAYLVKPQNLKVQFLSNGQIVERHEYQNFKENKLMYNLGHLTKGRYVVEIYINNECVYKNRINKD